MDPTSALAGLSALGGMGGSQGLQQAEEGLAAQFMQMINSMSQNLLNQSLSAIKDAQTDNSDYPDNPGEV